ncbi:sensor histidine kinase [Actinocatenispora comari]|uniref:histidine kinase n=1 Tax=Actinocatenispora comari TaxID=2807577 RepID=A0A8J4AL41_9ACTN|nr:sensor histidine kinase [Actinocatenispora comari]GIL31797.1 histidine kinase [Actinocatenispora comari]
MIGRAGRALGYLALGAPAAIVALAWTLVSSILLLLLAPTQLAPRALLGATAVSRALARFERWRLGWYSRRPVPVPYQPTAAGPVRVRAAAVFRDPATRRDAGWLAALFPLALPSMLLAVVPTALAAGLTTAPAWLWAVPNPNAPELVAPIVGTWPGRAAAAVLGLALAPLAARWVLTLARGQAGLARLLLRPDDRQQLTALAERLATTRARVVDAQAAELRRIERDLHDGAQARIVAAGMTLALADRKLRGRPDDPVRADVELARRQLDGALAELRHLVRGVHPPILTDRGLAAALGALIADSPLPVDLRVPDDTSVPPAVEAAAYFVVSEALTNAAKHAGAQRCEVTLAGTADGGLTVRVRDDGQGGADPDGAGLDGLRRRVEALDGILSVQSPAGGPTVLSAEFPCAS